MGRIRLPDQRLLSVCSKVSKSCDTQGDAWHLRINLIAQTSDIDKSDNVNGELAKNRSNDVDVEDVWLRSLFAKSFHDSSSRNAQETDRHEHSTDGILSVAKFDALKIQNGQGVSANEAVQCENFVHLNRGNKRATALANNIRNSNNVAKL